MRRKIILTIIAAIYFFMAVLGIYLGHRKSRPLSAAQPQVASIAGSAETKDPLVFVEKNSRWYHRHYCRELEKSPIPAKLSLVRDYCRPCPRCMLLR